jgi:hypothetical protein
VVGDAAGRAVVRRRVRSVGHTNTLRPTKGSIASF